MNYKLLFASALLIGASACSNSPETTEDIEQESNAASTSEMNHSDDSSGETSAQATKMKLAALTFDDYISLNTKELIKAQFGGEDEMEDGTSMYHEGTIEYDHTIVTNPATTHEVKYLWNPDGSLSFVEANHIKYDENYEEKGIQMLDTESGIYLGMPLEELVKWNGDDFDFYGFGWDYAGGIKLEKNSKLANSGFVVRLSMRYKQDTPTAIMGDILLNSSDDLLDGKEIFVSNISYYHDKQE